MLVDHGLKLAVVPQCCKLCSDISCVWWGILCSIWGMGIIGSASTLGDEYSLSSNGVWFGSLSGSVSPFSLFLVPIMLAWWLFWFHTWIWMVPDFPLFHYFALDLYWLKCGFWWDLTLEDVCKFSELIKFSVPNGKNSGVICRLLSCSDQACCFIINCIGGVYPWNIGDFRKELYCVWNPFCSFVWNIDFVTSLVI